MDGCKEMVDRDQAGHKKCLTASAGRRIAQLPVALARRLAIPLPEEISPQRIDRAPEMDWNILQLRQDLLLALASPCLQFLFFCGRREIENGGTLALPNLEGPCIVPMEVVWGLLFCVFCFSQGCVGCSIEILGVLRQCLFLIENRGFEA